MKRKSIVLALVCATLLCIVVVVFVMRSGGEMRSIADEELNRVLPGALVQATIISIREAGQFVQELSAHWNAEEYQQAKDKIEAKLAAKPGWLPAVILKSAYYRYIEVDCDTALAVLETIEGTVASLDPDTYANFIAAYTIYKHALEAEAAENFTEQEKNARRELAHEIFVYFPASEIVALYFSWINN